MEPKLRTQAYVLRTRTRPRSGAPHVHGDPSALGSCKSDAPHFCSGLLELRKVYASKEAID